MSLQGSLETFALPDVLVLLASTRKDGELRVSGGSVDGRVWLDRGQIVHTSVGGAATGALDGVFELLRLESGSFTFDGAGDPPARSGPESIDRVLAGAQARLAEWNEIVLVVPDLDAVVDMASEAPADEVTVTRRQWKLVRTVAGGRTVRSLMGELATGEFDTCKTVKELVEARLVTLETTPRHKAPGPAGAPAAAAREEGPARARREPGTAVPGADDRAGFDRGSRAEAAGRHGRGSRAGSEADAGPRPPAPASRGARAASGGPRAVEVPAVEDAKALVAQLAALGGEDEEQVAQKVAEHLASGGELPQVPAGDEPINRGLLLKFLSSVRN